jgi:DNA-binding CsgD family transcriptional regulator
VTNIKDLPAPVELSDREIQVLCLIAEGKTLSEMADVLTLSTKTISTYRARLMEKLNAVNNAALIHYAITHGYVMK